MIIIILLKLGAVVVELITTTTVVIMVDFLAGRLLNILINSTGIDKSIIRGIIHQPLTNIIISKILLLFIHRKLSTIMHTFILISIPHHLVLSSLIQRRLHILTSTIAPLMTHLMDIIRLRSQVLLKHRTIIIRVLCGITLIHLIYVVISRLIVVYCVVSCFAKIEL